MFSPSLKKKNNYVSLYALSKQKSVSSCLASFSVITYIYIYTIYIVHTYCGVIYFATGRSSSPGTPVSSTNKTDSHDITEILLKVVLNIITLLYMFIFYVFGDLFISHQQHFWYSVSVSNLLSRNII